MKLTDLPADLLAACLARACGGDPAALLDICAAHPALLRQFRRALRVLEQQMKLILKQRVCNLAALFATIRNRPPGWTAGPVQAVPLPRCNSPTLGAELAPLTLGSELAAMRSDIDALKKVADVRLKATAPAARDIEGLLRQMDGLLRTLQAAADACDARFYVPGPEPVATQPPADGA